VVEIILEKWNEPKKKSISATEAHMKMGDRKESKYSSMNSSIIERLRWVTRVASDQWPQLET